MTSHEVRGRHGDAVPCLDLAGTYGLLLYAPNVNPKCCKSQLDNHLSQLKSSLHGQIPQAECLESPIDRDIKVED